MVKSRFCSSTTLPAVPPLCRTSHPPSLGVILVYASILDNIMRSNLPLRSVSKNLGVVLQGSISYQEQVGRGFGLLKGRVDQRSDISTVIYFGRYAPSWILRPRCFTDEISWQKEDMQSWQSLRGTAACYLAL